MEITALDTNRTAEIVILDSNHVCYAADMLGNNGCPHEWNSELGRYEIGKDEDLVWWEKYAHNEQLTSNAYQVMKNLGLEKIWIEAIEDGCMYDLQDQAINSLNSAIAALEDGNLLAGYKQENVEEAHHSLSHFRDMLETF
jgi:hypothetical protein